MNRTEIPLETKQLREILVKGWMTHDAMWFYNCLDLCGIETANKLNQLAIKSMSAVEIMRMKKALGVDKIESFDEFGRFFDRVMAIVSADFMKFWYSRVAMNNMHAEWQSCFSFEGVKSRGLLDHYDCGIFLRIDTWLNTLGIRYEAEPLPRGCTMMRTYGKCYRDYRFFFEE